MAKAFSDVEKQVVRSYLLVKGRAIFNQYGLKKTTVEELAKAAGIAKGSFYLFFDSKEALFFEIMEESEKQYRAKVEKDLFQSGLAPREVIKKLLISASNLLDTNPLYKELLEPGTMQSLMRKIPPEKLQEHLEGDVEFSEKIFSAWKKDGIMINKDSKVLTGIFKLIIFTNLHREMVGEEIFPEVLNILAESISRYLIIS